MLIKVGLLLKTAAALGVLVALPIAAADMSGRWKISGEVAGNPIKADCLFAQDGTKFTGSCKATPAAPEWKVEGLVNDPKVIFHHDVDYEGATYTLNYSGKFESDTTIKGDIDVGGAGGEFTATRDGASSAAQSTSPSSDPHINAKVNELLAKMTVEEKIGQLTQIGGIPLMPDQYKPEERVQTRRGGFHSLAGRSNFHQPAAEDLDRRNPAAYSAVVRAGCDSRFQDHLPYPARNGRLLGHGDGGTGANRRRARGQSRGHSVDLCAHVGHRP